MSKKRYLEAEMLKEFLRMGMKVGHIHTLREDRKSVPARSYPAGSGRSMLEKFQV